MPQNNKYHYNRERLLLVALVGAAFLGFLLWSIEQTNSEENSLLTDFTNLNFPFENEAIKITSPKIGAAIKSPVKISGQTTLAKTALQIRLKDASGLTLAQTKIRTADSQKMSPFSANVQFKKPTRAKGMLEFYSLSPIDNSEINKLTIPVKFSD